MDHELSSLCIIPARGGSKRIPRKNVRQFLGKPMLTWSIEAAKNSGVFKHIIVSTDDNKIAEIAREYGAKTPFLRPPELSNDVTPIRLVVQHAISKAIDRYGHFDLACCISATAPFIQADDIRKGFYKMHDRTYNFAFSVTSFAYPIQRALRLTQAGVEMISPEYYSSRSQDLEEAYHDAGQFYWGKINAFMKNVPTFSKGSYPIILPRYRVQDIDTEEDWQVAEHLCRAFMESGEGAEV